MSGITGIPGIPGITRTTGVVHLVGAGPGDPGLLTIRGLRLLETADVVVHDRLVSDGVLALIPAGRLRIDVGKAAGGRSTPQAEINAMLIRLARAGKDVVRLKGGDPFVFGRGGEEVLALRAAGVEVDVVPGVTAGIAGPAAAGIPVTHRGLARSVAFVTGETGTDAGGAPVDWAAVAGVDTVVVYMAGRTARTIADQLLVAGRASTTPVAVVIDATLPTETVRRMDLGRLAHAGPGPLDGRPVLLVVGEVAALALGLDAALLEATG
jgi:uroporphyrin-III C-methyltransferase